MLQLTFSDLLSYMILIPLGFLTRLISFAYQPIMELFEYCIFAILNDFVAPIEKKGLRRI